MSDNSNNSKRIVKNTVILYVRMLFLMAISLFTTRVILQVLGVEDYGIYNVVGGVVALFNILSQALSSACSRFLNFEMGRGNYERLRKVFSTSLTIQIVLAITIALLAEVIGGWFLNNKMVIPTERLDAANWVLHFSIITFCINLISVPYNAVIIAHERMKAFAYISLYEGIARLLICYLLFMSPIDRLVLYALLICLIQLSIRLIYSFYCNRHFEETHYEYSYDKSLLRELVGFTGWNFIGASSVVLRTQGGNILINLFAGPSVNAARGVANQVNHAISGFSSSFMTAVKPQITKSYAAGDIRYMSILVNQSAKFSLYLLLFLSLPILVNIEFILSIWLKVVPASTEIFVILTIVFTIVESLSNPLITAQMATGKVRNYQLLVGGLNLLNIPFSYILLRLGYPAYIFLVVAIVLSIVCMFARIFMVQVNAGLPASSFIKNVIFKGGFVVVTSAIFPLILNYILPFSFGTFVLKVFVSVACTTFSVAYIGCTKGERAIVYGKIKKIIKKRK